MSLARMKLIGGAGPMESHPELYPELVAQIGRYVTRYEPENALKAEQWIWTTDDPEEALTLETSEMIELWQTSIGTRPWDGKPDRPITAFHVQMEKLQ